MPSGKTDNLQCGLNNTSEINYPNVHSLTVGKAKVLLIIHSEAKLPHLDGAEKMNFCRKLQVVFDL